MVDDGFNSVFWLQGEPEIIGDSSFITLHMYKVMLYYVVLERTIPIHQRAHHEPS